jgi:hypothetical protein
MELPFNGGQQGFTMQANWMHFDGGTFLPSIAKQDAYLAEMAFHFGKGKVSPFVQYAEKNMDAPSLADQRSWQAGVAFWMAGHQRSLKISAGRQKTAGGPERLQVLAQLQILYF